MNKIKILLISNEAIILSGRKTSLEFACNYVKTALCGNEANENEANEIVEAEIPGIVITDLMMSKMNGIEVCRRIKARYPNVEAVLVSGTPDKIRKYLQDFLHTEGGDISTPPLFDLDTRKVNEHS